MDVLKLCSKYKMGCIKYNFHKITKMSDGFNPQCKICRKKYSNENLVKIKTYYLDSCDRRKE